MMYNRQLETFLCAADERREVLLSGRQIHDPVRQGRPNPRPERHAEQ